MKKVRRKKLMQVLLSEAIIRQRLEITLATTLHQLGQAERRVLDLEARLREMGVRS